MATKKRLGRNMSALLAGSGTLANENKSGTGSDGDLRNLPVELIQRGKYQPRMDMRSESLEELANSIRQQGVIQPIVARPIGNGRYEIIAGERRWRACQMAGLHEIPAIIREVADEAAIAMALIENIQRENLNPMEESMALKRLIDEFELTHQQAAEAVGRSRAAVSNLLRLQDLRDEVKRLLEHREIEMGHARAMLALEGREQVEVANKVVRKGLSVRETEQLVRHLQTEIDKQKAPAPRKDPDIQRLEVDLGERLGAGVAIQHTSRGRGKLVISYTSLEELEGILEHIK